MTNRISQFIRLPLRDKLMMARAFWLLLIVHQGLRRLSFKRIRRWARSATYPPGKTGPSRVSDEAIDHIAWCVSTVAAHHPLEMQCLERALALQRLLQGRGIPAEFRIGVEKEGDALHAHAWLEVDGRPVYEPAEIDKRFRPLISQMSSTETY
jgi:hypothetical protein